MLKKTIKYKDYDGKEREEDFYFNLTKTEITKMEMSTEGGVTKMIDGIIKTKDSAKMVLIFDDFIKKAYGEKSPDGRRFIKSEELSIAFMQTEAYDILYQELVTNADYAAEFFNSIIPNVPEATVVEVPKG